MSYGEAKVYFDGSHYIAIPHTTRPVKKHLKRHEELITVIQEDKNEEGSLIAKDGESLLSVDDSENSTNDEKTSKTEEKCEKNEEKPQKTLIFGYTTTRKDLFDDLYMKYINLPRKERRLKIIEKMIPYFDKKEYCVNYVDANIERKKRNLICRRVRMVRKANLANFNYFCTFTYNNNLHTEESFKKKLKACFRNLCYRKNWKYMGVWERAEKTNRLHFHGLFNIPDGSMPGEIVEVRDYSTQFHKMQTTFQSSFFNERFGRSDFKKIDEYERRLGNALAYLMKYIEKTGEKIVYSKGLPQYFISDVLDEDVVTTIGQEDRKLLLFDDFKCWDEGVFMGKVCPEVIEQMRKSN